MPRYIKWDAVAGRYPEVAKSVSQVQLNATSAFIAGAEAEVDARLAVRYATPFDVASVPVLVQDLCIDLTYVKMARRTKESKRVEDALMKTFEALVNGTMILADQGVPNGAWVEKEYHTSFGQDDPLNWRVDSNYLSDVEDDRR